VSTSLVFTEVVTFFNSRGRHAKAVELGRFLLTSSSVRLLHLDADLFHAGWDLFQRNRDKRYSLTDAVSFTVMKRMRLQVALTFDRHFLQAGFECRPEVLGY
jgi:predicted nucleic acid-binding protein